MEIIIKTNPAYQIIGMKREISFAENTTSEIWQNFMPRRHEISDKINSDLFSISIYTEDFFRAFDIHNKFEKCAGIAVKSTESIPEGMQLIPIEEGMYATFIYKGLAENYPKVFQNILQHWIPENGYQIDNRPFFEILGEKYKRNSEESEEEIWIPIRVVSNE